MPNDPHGTGHVADDVTNQPSPDAPDDPGPQTFTADWVPGIATAEDKTITSKAKPTTKAGK